jgi:hypothetical protein
MNVIAGMLRAFAIVAMFVSTPAAAAPPNDVQVDGFKKLHGYDLSIDEVRNAAFRSSDWLDAQKRTCLADGIATSLEQSMDRLIADSFVSAETLAEFLAWARTQAGTKFISYLHAGMIARINKVAAPDREAFKQTLTGEERDDIDRFIESPAGQASAAAEKALMADFELTDAMFDQVARDCGIENTEGR